MRRFLSPVSFLATPPLTRKAIRWQNSGLIVKGVGVYDLVVTSVGLEPTQLKINVTESKLRVSAVS
ncbi:MAG: hypothetical protein ACOYXT_26985 [Bacteroidota bacterium]